MNVPIIVHMKACFLRQLFVSTIIMLSAPRMEWTRESGYVGVVVTGHNGHKPKRPQPKRPQTETAKNSNGHKPERPQTETATNRNGHKPERPQTETATNRNGHKLKWPQTGTATNRNGHISCHHHISCHQNIYDGESPIGNDDIHTKLHRNRSKGWNPRTCNSIQVINWTDEAK